MTLLARTDLEALFTSGTPLLDVRAPVEFASGAFPNTINLPLLDDDERAAVGLTYKNEGQDAAVQLGHSLVSGQVKRDRVEQWCAFAKANPDATLYCLRGGLRSQISQQWLADAGVQMPRVDGGFKRMRNWLMERTAALANEFDVVVLAGRTGVGKTRVIEQLAATADLERLANHRGSAFGRWPDPQPTQIDFENTLAVELIQLWEQGYRSVVLEDEGTNVGKLSVPPSLVKHTRVAPMVVLEASVEQRVDETVRGYITQTLAVYQKRFADEAAFTGFSDALLASLDRIKNRLGGARHKTLRQTMHEALEEHRQTSDANAHREWIRVLLTEYYDPMYDYQLASTQDRVVYRGNLESVVDWLTGRTATD